jgi:hypothetical protein
MLAVVDIKKDLPNWPDDVIDQWLLYFANEPDCGWPPPDPLGRCVRHAAAFASSLGSLARS